MNMDMDEEAGQKHTCSASLPIKIS
jgi:hypothetical protein